MSSAKHCVEANGIWTPLSALFPGKELNEYDANRYLCNIQTGDKGEKCYTSRSCEGSCLAPPGAKPGERINGTCSGGILVPQGTLTIDSRYSVSNPEQSTASYPAKIDRLETLRTHKAKWRALNISDYELMISQSCFCLYGPYYGPNKVSVRNDDTKTVRYYGEVRDGFQPGDRLDPDDSVSLNIEDMFNHVEKRIINATENALLEIDYHPEYGFPVRMNYDHPGIADEENEIRIEDFKPR